MKGIIGRFQNNREACKEGAMDKKHRTDERGQADEKAAPMTLSEI